jgi:hypothetical protein
MLNHQINNYKFLVQMGPKVMMIQFLQFVIVFTTILSSYDVIRVKNG